MDELQEIIRDTELRAKAIARLLSLIDMDSAIIARELVEGNASTVAQYEALRNENVSTLAKLIEGPGTLLADLRVRPVAA